MRKLWDNRLRKIVMKMEKFREERGSIKKKTIALNTVSNDPKSWIDTSSFEVSPLQFESSNKSEMDGTHVYNILIVVQLQVQYVL